MKGRKEDDDGKPRTANESMRINPFADQLVHVELGQLSKYSRSQLKPEKGRGVLNGVLPLFNYYMILPLSESKVSGGFCDFYVQFLMTKMILK